MNTKGTKIEDLLIAAIDGKTYDQLTHNFRNLIDTLWQFPKRDEVFHVVNTINCIKPDVIITYGGESKGLSIKTGNAHVVQTQYVKSFVKFLYDIGISKETIKTILLVHYGDGTINGTGKFRFERDTVYDRLQSRVDKANEELNADREIIKKVVDYCVFDGVDPNAEKADAIYYGDEYEGYTANRLQFHKWLERKPWDFLKCLHVGPVVIRAHARYANKPIKNPDAREHCALTFPNLKDDIAYIAKYYAPFPSPYFRMEKGYVSKKDMVFKEQDEFMNDVFKDETKLGAENSDLEMVLSSEQEKIHNDEE